MKPRARHALGFVACVLVLPFLIGGGCRTTEPLPGLNENPPDTDVAAGLAEFFGREVQRRILWSGTDPEGREIHHFIWALTDSLLKDGDSLDLLFDPADFPATLTPNGRFRQVGTTSRLDSTFSYFVGESGEIPHRPVFHVAAVDIAGKIDPTPARLILYDRGLGEPQIEFEVSTFDQGPLRQERLRWRGSALGPAPDSPEQTPHPYVGYAQSFRISWQATSPNGAIVGYLFQPGQLEDAPYLPLSDARTGAWSEVTFFDYANELSEAQLPGDCDGGWDCPGLRRWDSGPHRLRVSAMDDRQVDVPTQAGTLRFEVNYPPETAIDFADGYPRAHTPSGVMQVMAGTTVPTGSYVVVRMRGRDRLPDRGFGPELCCDQRLDDTGPEVRYEGQLLYQALSDPGIVDTFVDGYSDATEADTLGFRVGPFDYVFKARCRDEHGRGDDSPDSVMFSGGFPPHVTGVEPPEGAALVLRDPRTSSDERWPENSVNYRVDRAVTRYWDGTSFQRELLPQRRAVTGSVFRYDVRLTGRADDREPAEAVRAWSYELFSGDDPENLGRDGPGEDRLSSFTSSPADDLWDLTQGEGFEIFVPDDLWLVPDPYDPPPGYTPPSDEAWKEAAGRDLRRRLGELVLRVRGKTRRDGDTFVRYPQSVRPSGSSEAVDMALLGRRSATFTRRFSARLGLEAPGFPGVIDRMWP